jgi:Mlc titration factor MtfA (ptsG expression regulator)
VWLDDDERDRLGEHAGFLLSEKRWEASRGFALSDEVCTIVATQAALMILEIDPAAFRLVDTVLVHPRPMRSTGPQTGPAPGVVSAAGRPVAGHTRTHGPVVIAWNQARADAARPELGRNVVMHEFAHKIDLIDSVLDGTPPVSDADRARWEAVVSAELEAAREGTSALRPYAGHNAGELFAVASETFFCRPEAMATDSADLYGLLADFYRQDPARRLPPSDAAAVP